MPNWIVSNNADMLAKAYLSDEDDFDQSDTLGGTASVSKRVRPDGPTPSAWHFASILVLVSLVVSGSMLSSIALEHKLQTPFTIPSLPEQNPCEHATARPSWHSLPLHRRHGYKRAVERLTTLPSRLGLNTSLYDDFTYIHVQLIWYTHHAAISLPYHRYFLSIFEKTLRIEGGYDQPIPFWDWTLDAEQPFESPIWHEFGGFGPVIIDCVGNKSANYTEHGYQPHCVRRNFNSTAEDGVMHSHHWRREVVKDVVETSKTYAEFRSQLESGPHKHFHLGIGGEMLTASSTNDPLFFLHHAQIDRLWWLWQQKDPDTRLSEFSGPVMSSSGDATDTEASLLDTIVMLGLAADIAVGDVMKTDSALLCYKYKNEL